MRNVSSGSRVALSSLINTVIRRGRSNAFGIESKITPAFTRSGFGNISAVMGISAVGLLGIGSTVAGVSPSVFSVGTGSPGVSPSVFSVGTGSTVAGVSPSVFSVGRGSTVAGV